jgi:hypothetical protein
MKKETKEVREKAKTAARIEAEKNQKPVSRIKINIEWSKSRTWGRNPHLEAWVSFKDGTSEYYKTTCSGCGYDKESTVIADVFNQFLKYKLWGLSEKAIEGGHGSGDKGPAPYGINRYEFGRSYAGGIGTSCYRAISEYIGGKWENIASGKTFDVYEYEEAQK